MSMIEEVRGTIIGKTPIHRAAIYYSGRRQYQHDLFADTEQELMDQAKGIKRKLIASCPVAYPDDSLWELRIYHN